MSVVISLSGLHSCVEIIISGNWSIGGIWRGLATEDSAQASQRDESGSKRRYPATGGHGQYPKPGARASTPASAGQSMGSAGAMDVQGSASALSAQEALALAGNRVTPRGCSAVHRLHPALRIVHPPLSPSVPCVGASRLGPWPGAR